MKKIVIYLILFSLMFICEISQADVLIDLANEDEISISNTEPNGHYTLKLIEPAEVAVYDRVSKQKKHGRKQVETNPARLPYHRDVLFAASQTSLEPALIHAVIAVESKHNANAVSQKGAVGLMQLMPATAMRFHATDIHNTKQHILAGAQYLRTLVDQFDGNLSLGLAAYNAGPGAVLKYQHQIPPYKETQHYVPKVLQYYRSYSKG